VRCLCTIKIANASVIVPLCVHGVGVGVDGVWQVTNWLVNFRARFWKPVVARLQLATGEAAPSGYMHHDGLAGMGYGVGDGGGEGGGEGESPQ
jgi:hypothetical protein